MRILTTYLTFIGIIFPFVLFSQDLNSKENSKIISKGGTSGDYQAFTDLVKINSGEILCVFYAGDSHVTYPSSKYPNSGRICLVRSKDNGKNWSQPITIYDDIHDNRDPHISQMKDGTLIVTFFNTQFGELIENNNKISKNSIVHYQGERRLTKNGGIHYIISFDNGLSWGNKTSIDTGILKISSSAPLRELRNGTWIFPSYYQGPSEAYGTIFISNNKGKNWSNVITIGKGSNKFLPAETDIIQLKDGSILAALRGDIKSNSKMHFAISKNDGYSWGKLYSSNFQGHCPHFIRLSNGAIILTYRAFTDDSKTESGYTGLKISFDEGKSWQGPYLIDSFWGAYASTVELPNNKLLIAYYEEGKNSAVRVIKTEIPQRKTIHIDKQKPVKLSREAI
ncbi:sialidase family protein [Sphingobacterium daejeonense]|uniref:exo-alpha-sialidase n=1 Tax=Sphingobacterium daejeonense TaxID=371142 RepID=A0ABW3RLG6_9SPHI